MTTQQHGFSYYHYGNSKGNSDYNQNNSTMIDQMSGNFQTAMDLHGRIKKTRPPPVAPKPSTKELPLRTDTREQILSWSPVSPPEEFRDPTPTGFIPVPAQFAERPLYHDYEPQVTTPKRSAKPVPKPRHASVSKTSSLESSNSNSSSIASSCDSIPSSPSLQRQRKVRKQRTSISKESVKRFLEKHSKTGLTATLPTTDDAASRTPYSDDWIKKKQYLSFQKQHVCRDAKFDGECNIILTTKFSVQMYDNNGVFKEKLYQNRVMEPWGLHINHATGNTLVTDHEDGCIKEFNAIGIVVQEYGPIPHPCGVTVSDHGYVFACSQSEGCVYVFDKRGEIVTKLGKGALTAPTYIVLHGKSVLVSDDSSIVAFSIANDIQFIYGQRDGSDHPACLCVDTKTGYVLSTSYYKDSIAALSKSMQRAIKIKDIKRPLTCTISPFGHLLIGEHSSRGMLFRMFRM